MHIQARAGTILEYCKHRTAQKCQQFHKSSVKCKKVHFVVNLNKFTNMNSNRDCNFLDRCPKLRRGQPCFDKHYMVEDDYKDINPRSS